MTTTASTSRTLRLRALISEQKRESYTPGSFPSDADALGGLVAAYFLWDGLAILRTAEAALTDANFHADAAVVAEMAGKYEPTDDEPIDQPLRSALFAALRDHYGPAVGKDRDRRLGIVNKIVRREGPGVDSFSDRARFPLTRGEAKLVLDVLNA